MCRDYHRSQTAAVTMLSLNLFVRGSTAQIIKNPLSPVAVLLFFGSTCLISATHPSQVNVGAILGDGSGDSIEELALRAALEIVNENRRLLPRTNLTLTTAADEGIDGFRTIQHTCFLAAKGSVAIIGPLRSSQVKISQQITSRLQLVHLAPTATSPLLSLLPESYPLLVKMSSPDNVQNRALVQLIQHFGWQRFSIITSLDDYGMQGLQQLLTGAAEREWSVATIQRFAGHHAAILRRQGGEPTVGAQGAGISDKLTKVKETGARVVILHCHVIEASLVLEQAHKMGMTGQGWAWVVTGDITVSGGAWNGTEPPDYLLGVLGTRPGVSGGALKQQFEVKWASITSRQIQAVAYLVCDSVLALANGLDSYLEAGHTLSKPKFSQKVCSTSEEDGSVEPWADGSTLLDHIVKGEYEGVASQIKFTDVRTPVSATYDYVSLKKRGFVKVGEWRETGDYEMDDSKVTFMGGVKERPSDTSQDLKNVTLIITTIREEPFMMLKSEVSEDAGNERFWGYCKDMLDELQGRLGFRYVLQEVPDNAYGSLNPHTNQWNGMVHQLLHQKADLAVASFTISYERQQVIDFTNPYLDLGLSILMAKLTADGQSTLAFLQPFSNDLWLAFLVSLAATSVLVVVCSYLSPFGWFGAYAQRLDPQNTSLRDTRNTMNPMEGFWFAFSSFTQQGSDYRPKSMSGRIMGGLWWVACLIIVATYTANLAAFLTIAKMSSGIGSLEDLNDQNQLDYGTVRDSQPESYFATQATQGYEPYKKMYSTMQDYDTMVGNSVEGIKKVRQEGYAFIWDSPVLDYISNKEPCDVYTIGRPFAKIGYGIGLQKMSPYKDQFNSEILRLREQGFFDTLHEKYFEGVCDKTDSLKPKPGGKRLEFHDMRGVFYCLFCTCALSLTVLVLEWFHATYKDTRKNQHQPTSFCKALKLRISRMKQHCSKCTGEPGQPTPAPI